MLKIFSSNEKDNDESIQHATAVKKNPSANAPNNSITSKNIQETQQNNDAASLISITAYSGEKNNNGERHGMGVQTFTNGVYNGQWKNNKMWGKGIFIFHSGSRYEGELENDMFHGSGSYYWADGKVYLGSYCYSQRDGFGKQVYTNGNVYEGEWKADKKQGNGLMIYASGSSYYGGWNANKKHGPGVYSDRHGKHFDEMWEYGKIVKSTPTNSTQSPLEQLKSNNRNNQTNNSEQNASSLHHQQMVQPLIEQNRLLQQQLVEISRTMTNEHEDFKSKLKESDRKNKELARLIKEKNNQISTLNSTNTKLQKDLEEEQYKMQCVICFERRRDTLLLPCMHFLGCQPCLVSVNRCPQCRSTVHGKLQCILQT